MLVIGLWAQGFGFRYKASRHGIEVVDVITCQMGGACNLGFRVLRL